MMTPTSPVYAVLALYGVCFFGGAFVVEMIALLKENHWNVLATIKSFLRDF
jgi:hypothetical protein